MNRHNYGGEPRFFLDEEFVDSLNMHGYYGCGYDDPWCDNYGNVWEESENVSAEGYDRRLAVGEPAQLPNLRRRRRKRNRKKKKPQPVPSEEQTEDGNNEPEAAPAAEVNTQELRQPVPEVNTQELSQPAAEANAQELSQPAAEVNTQELSQPAAEVNTQELSQPAAEVNTEELSQPAAGVNTQEFRQPVSEIYATDDSSYDEEEIQNSRLPLDSDPSRELDERVNDIMETPLALMALEAGLEVSQVRLALKQCISEHGVPFNSSDDLVMYVLEAEAETEGSESDEEDSFTEYEVVPRPWGFSRSQSANSIATCDFATSTSQGNFRQPRGLPQRNNWRETPPALTTFSCASQSSPSALPNWQRHSQAEPRLPISMPTFGRNETVQVENQWRRPAVLETSPRWQARLANPPQPRGQTPPASPRQPNRITRVPVPETSQRGQSLPASPRQPNRRPRVPVPETFQRGQSRPAYPPQPDGSSENRDSKLCTICYEEDVKTVFLPCQHIVCCATCSGKIHQCPICRRGISQKINVYFA